MITNKDFKAMWQGRTFKCTTTGEEFKVPDDVYQGAFYSFGESFIDVGDGYYWRCTPGIEETTPYDE